MSHCILLLHIYLDIWLSSSLGFGISDGSCIPGLYVTWTELCSFLSLGSGSSFAFNSEAHWPASLNSCYMRCLTITPLVGVMALNHIQMSTLVVLSKLSSSCWMVVKTPLEFYCHWASITAMSVGVPSQILKHSDLFDQATSCNCYMSVHVLCA